MYCSRRARLTRDARAGAQVGLFSGPTAFKGRSSLTAAPSRQGWFAKHHNRSTMGFLLKDPLHDGFASWALGYAPYGGTDPGEVVAIARAIGDGDDSAYYVSWTAAADRLVAEGDHCLSKGQRRSAREAYLHAASF